MFGAGGLSMIRPGLSIVQMLTDPDEGRFLQVIFTAADNGRAFPEYAEYLRGRDEVRSEFLRLEHLLSGPGTLEGVEPQRQDRYRELLRLLAPWDGWLRIVKRNDRILNCGQAAPQALAVRFAYQCPNQWETLSPTGEAGVRSCGDCRRNVYFCDSVAAVERHAGKGDCIAVPRAVTASVYQELTSCLVGMPDVHQLWGEKLSGG
jgi:hypothetical protein